MKLTFILLSLFTTSQANDRIEELGESWHNSCDPPWK